MSDTQTQAPTTPSTGPNTTDQARMKRRVLASAFVGSVIEWYDFYLFGFAAAAVFNVLFFPQFSSLAGTLASFATLGAGFIARPLGGIIWGHFGDRVGRKAMLILSIVLMGIATTLIGLLPTYEQIGIWAPVLLVVMRLIQGLSAGGEWGGAVLMTMEHSSHRRGLSSSVAQMGVFGGILAANGALALVSSLPEDDFMAWGWRLPFIASAGLLAVGLWIRLGVQESPVFQQAQAASAQSRTVPVVEVLKQPKNLLLSLMLVLGPFAGSAIFLIFAVSYALEIGLPQNHVLNATVVAAAIGFVGQPIFAAISDYVGRRVVVGTGTVLLAAGIPVMFALIETGEVHLLYLGIALVALTHAIVYSPLGAWLGELFPTYSRYTGASMGYQIAGSVGGGLTPLIAASLLAASGGPPHSMLISLFMAALCAVTLVAAFLAKETHRASLQ